MKRVSREQELVAELEAQLGRPITRDDWDCLDVNPSTKTLTVARNPLLAEIRALEGTRTRDFDLPPNPGQIDA